MTQIANQTALVTGANRGMGKHYVDQLLQRGAGKVFAAARDPRSIEAQDDRVVPLELDVTDASSVRRAAASAPEVGILINNAGVSSGGSVLDADPSALRAEMETNLYGPLALAAAFSGGIAQRSGAIVNVSSVLAWLPVGGTYSVTKAALWSATDVMRMDLAPRGVHVLGAYFGLVDTDMTVGREGPKSAPADIVRAVLDGLESDELEVLADDLTRDVRLSLHRPVAERVARVSAAS